MQRISGTRRRMLHVGSPLLLLGLLLAGPPPSYGQSVVTTYVIDTQAEREKTRWTLTEWLRIKERMRLMDVWLAMFSNPQKSEFKPEIQLSYSVLGGKGDTFSSTGNGVDTVVRGRRVEGQLWLTNLFSGAFGLNTLNIDLGLFAGDRRMIMEENAKGEDEQSAVREAVGQSSWRAGKLANQYYFMMTQYGGALRIFGKNVQDTSLVGKFGLVDVQSKSHLHHATPFSEEAAALNGRMWGAEMQMYLLKYLGLHGTYENVQAKSSDLELDDHFYFGQIFVEVSLIRFGFGYFGSGQRAEVSSPASTGSYGGSAKGLQLLTGLSF